MPQSLGLLRAGTDASRSRPLSPEERVFGEVRHAPSAPARSLPVEPRPAPDAPPTGAANQEPGKFGLILSSRGIWIWPLVNETLLVAAAAQVSRFFFEVMRHGDSAGPLFGLGVVLAGHAAIALHVRLRELFMPRPVILLGLFPLLGLGIGVLVLGLMSPRWFGEPLNLMKRAIILLPLVLALVRTWMIIRAARFAPRMSTLRQRQAKPDRAFVRLRRMWSYWMS